MTPHDIDRVFGRGRLKMLTGPHVEVFREAAARGESRRYTKRFLTTAEGDYAQWTEREWRILARLTGHGARCVPEIVQYDRGAYGTKLVQTYDAGATVDQWATLLPVERDGVIHAHVFEDCAHWWALAHHCLVGLDEIHALELVHLDVKGDNICIPIGPPQLDPAADGQRLFPVFRKLALIDFAFSLVSGETLPTALPIGWQQDYDYQSPRLLRALEAGRAGNLQPTEDLDWRCDMYSLAAMLKRYLPAEDRLYDIGWSRGWTTSRHDEAKALILRIREAHDRDPVSRRPHADLLSDTSAQLRDSELVESLERGWTLARYAQTIAAPVLPLTPVTRLALPLRIVIPARETTVTVPTSVVPAPEPETSSRARTVASLVAAAAIVAAIGVLAFNPGAAAWMTHAAQRLIDGSRATVAALRDRLAPAAPAVATASADPALPEPEPPPVEAPAEPPAEPPAPVLPPPEPVATDPVAKAPESQPSLTSPTRPAPVETGPSRASFAAQIEAHRTRPTTRSARVSRAAAPVAISSTVRRTPLQVSTRPARIPPASTMARLAPQSKRAAKVSMAAGTRTILSTPAPVSVPPVTVAAAPAADPIAPFATLPVAPVAPEAPREMPASAAPPPAVAKAPAPPNPPAERPRVVARANPVAPIDERPRPVETPALPPLPSAPVTEAPRSRPPAVVLDEDAAHLMRGKQLLEDVVPHTSAQVHARVSRVLWIATGSYHPLQERAILASSFAIANDRAIVTSETQPREARRLHEAARQAYQLRHHIPEAFDLATKAFGANPNDPEIAGHLAFLHLKVSPYQPERARQLALHALGLRKEPYPTSRFDDWTTFAVASALTGRQAEARHALYATLVLARDTDRLCRAMLGAVASYGERLRDPVEAMLQRLHMQGGADDSTHCSWLSARFAGSRYQ